MKKEIPIKRNPQCLIFSTLFLTLEDCEIPR